MMGAWQLSELTTPLDARLIGEDCTVRCVSTDSRSPAADALFVALVGENFDAHAYLDQASAGGAVAAVVSREVDSPMPLLQVADTQRALGRLGAYNRGFFSGPLVAITGSSGKTTVKNMVSSVLSQRGCTLATQGNLNNEIGVPVTLLSIESRHEFAVVEMGAARRGDIAWLCELGKPTVSLLLNAMPAHLEGFGSVEDVAAAKGEIFDSLGEDGVAVINADLAWADQWRERAAPARILDYGIDAPAALTAGSIRPLGVKGICFDLITPVGTVTVQLHIPGTHNVSNALAAAAAGLACGLELDEIRRGLEMARPVAGRLSVLQLKEGPGVIDDCYNANPGSVRAAIDLLADCPGRRTLVLGAMKELGDESEALHAEIGRYARAAGLDQFWGVGPELAVAVEAFGNDGRHFTDLAAAEAALPDDFGVGDMVLVKGSRSAGMEQVLTALQSQFGGVEN